MNIYIQRTDLPNSKFAPDAQLYAGKGWLSLVRQAERAIGSSEIRAIREDRGLLRIELEKPSKQQSRGIEIVQACSSWICEICGQLGMLRVDGYKRGKPLGWHRTRCAQHVDERIHVANATDPENTSNAD